MWSAADDTSQETSPYMHCAHGVDELKGPPEERCPVAKKRPAEDCVRCARDALRRLDSVLTESHGRRGGYLLSWIFAPSKNARYALRTSTQSILRFSPVNIHSAANAGPKS
jgi:hypothetical protein